MAYPGINPAIALPNPLLEDPYQVPPNVSFPSSAYPPVFHPAHRYAGHPSEASEWSERGVRPSEARERASERARVWHRVERITRGPSTRFGVLGRGEAKLRSAAGG